MGANIQWDAFQNDNGEALVRMLYNEKEIPFKEGCEPISEGSTFYTIDELSACLPLGSISDHSQAHIESTADSGYKPQSGSSVASSQPKMWAVVGALFSVLTIAVGTVYINRQQIESLLHKFGIQLPF